MSGYRLKHLEICTWYSSLLYIYIIGIVFTEDELNGDFGEVNFLCMNTCVLFPTLSLCHCASAPQLPS